MDVLERVEAHIRSRDLLAPGAEVTCLVSGGADSTCLWHVLGDLGYDVRAVHVAHGLRGAESEEDAAFCRDVLAAEVVDRGAESRGAGEAALRDIRYEAVRASGPGGQHVNKTDSAVRATHLPSGLSVKVQTERSQHANKRLARALLAHKLATQANLAVPPLDETALRKLAERGSHRHP